VKESIKARNSCSCFEKVIFGKYSSTNSTYWTFNFEII
jgi:hypothetical protein